MANSNDETLELSVSELREVLDELPHGIAKKLEAPLNAVVNEAYWLNTQRDRARERLATLNAQAGDSDSEDIEYLLNAILFLVDDRWSDADVLRENIRLLIGNHRDSLESDEELRAVGLLFEDLTALRAGDFR